MQLPTKDKIAGFDFEKNMVLVDTGRTLRGILADQPVYDVLPLTDEDKEVILDAWLDWKYRQR